MSIIILLVIGILVYANFNPEDNPLFPKCPVYALTGYQCPGCGFQRALHHLFHGHIVEALSYNSLIFILFPYIFLLIVLEYFVDKIRPAARKLRQIFLSKWSVLALAVLIVGFAVVRNL
ncbi:MAG: DUF2752 domain-containing protein [Tannerella sp.]|nr:DUF2752 domain-containing protein [Tannerella sp.]